MSKFSTHHFINGPKIYKMKWPLPYILLCTHVYSMRNSKINKNFLRIAGGRNATEEEFPYVVKLMLQPLTSQAQANIFICSGSVLTSKWTLTAGHCITSIGQMMSSNNMIQTRAMIEYQPSPKSEVAYSEVMNTALHPGLNLQSVKNDIGLLRTQPVLFGKYGKLSPLDYATLNGQEVSIVGYGMIKSVGEDPPRLPQVLDVIVKECSNLLHYPQICFAPSCLTQVDGARAICQGDSGGPAIHASGIVSINSMTDIRNCGMKAGGSLRRDRYDTGHDIGTATPVSPFVDWITSIMEAETA